MKQKQKKGIIRIVRDSWNSVISGLGTTGYDKTENTDIEYDPLGEQDAEELYGADDVAGRIVDELPEEALREGFELTAPELDQDDGKAIFKALEKLDAVPRFQDAWKWARMYGGAGLVLITDRLQDLANPLDESNIGEIKCLQLLSRYELVWNEIDLDIRSMHFGQPKSYRIQPRALAAPGAINVIVHASRIIRFDGVKVPRRMYIQNAYWNDSVLTRAKPAIRDYQISNKAVANALQDFSVATYKMKGLANMIGEGDSTAVLNRMQTVALTKSIARAVVIDADNEEFNYQNRSMAGVPEAVNLMSNRLVAASQMPHTKILGEGSGGLGNSGDSEKTEWYDFVKNKQTIYLKPKLLRLIKLLCLARRGPTNGQEIPDLDITFRPLWQMDEKDTATARQAMAASDVAYINAGVLDPAEVAKSRFGSGKYSQETQIDVSSRDSDTMALPDSEMAEIENENDIEPDTEPTGENGSLDDPEEQRKATQVDGGPGSGTHGADGGEKTSSEQEANIAAKATAAKKAKAALNRATNSADNKGGNDAKAEARMKQKAESAAAAHGAHAEALKAYMSHLQSKAGIKSDSLDPLINGGIPEKNPDPALADNTNPLISGAIPQKNPDPVLADEEGDEDEDFAEMLANLFDSSRKAANTDDEVRAIRSQINQMIKDRKRK